MHLFQHHLLPRLHPSTLCDNRMHLQPQPLHNLSELLQFDSVPQRGREKDGTEVFSLEALLLSVWDSIFGSMFQSSFRFR